MQCSTAVERTIPLFNKKQAQQSINDHSVQPDMGPGDHEPDMPAAVKLLAKDFPVRGSFSSEALGAP
jgi:hypothetical protein